MPRRALAFIAFAAAAVAVLYVVSKIFGFDVLWNPLLGAGVAVGTGTLGASRVAMRPNLRRRLQTVGHPRPEIVIGRPSEVPPPAALRQFRSGHPAAPAPSAPGSTQAPSPAPADSMQTLEQWLREAFSQLAQGYLDLAYKKKMYLDDSQDIKVRIREQTRAPLRRELDTAANELRIEETRVAPIMSVTLQSPNFDIQPEGESTRALFQGDATWVFHVTPRSGGTHSIRVMAAAVLKPPEYTQTLAYLPVSDISVDVRVHYLKKTTRTILSWAWKGVAALLGAAVAAFFGLQPVKDAMIQFYNGHIAPLLGLPPLA